jgi:hypothetical protein
MIFVTVFADQASAVDGLMTQISSDNIAWRDSDVFTIPADTEKTFSFQPNKRYFRIKYTNGIVNQGVFDLQTVLKKTNSKPSSHRIQDPISTEDDAELVKSVLTGQDPSGVFRNVNTTGDGDLTISNNSSGLAIAEGNVTGKSFVHKFGSAPDFDSGDNFVTIWDGADDGGANEMSYNYSGSAIIDSLSSSIAADTQDVEVQGLDSSYDLITQTITLIGRTRKALDTNLIRVFRIKNVGSTDLAGDVYCYENTALNLGVPIDTTKIRAVIRIGFNQTLMAVYTIPNGKTGYMRDWYASIAGAKKTSVHIVHVLIRPFGQVFQTKHVSSIIAVGNSNIQHIYHDPEIIPAKTDIEIRANSDEDQASVSAGFDIILVDD